MSLALWKTWGLKLRIFQKISLSTIYCLVIALVLFDIVRIVESLYYRSWTRSSLFDILEIVLVVIIAALPGYRVALSEQWLNNTFQRLYSLTSSSKRSLVSRLSRKRSHNAIDTEEAAPRGSGSTASSFKALKSEKLSMEPMPRFNETDQANKSFRAHVEGV